MATKTEKKLTEEERRRKEQRRKEIDERVEWLRSTMWDVDRELTPCDAWLLQGYRPY